MLNIFKLERRYTVFSPKTYKKLQDLISSMTTYTMDALEKRKLTDYYYDDKEGLLLKNELLLRKRVYSDKAEIKIKRRYFQEEYQYTDNLRSHEREKEIDKHSYLSDHFFFLNNALNSMFSNNLQFDPDKLFAEVRVVMTIEAKQETRKIFGYGGLKIEFRHEDLKVFNKITNRKNKTETIQFKLLSSDETLPLFDDFIKKIEKHCKEIFYTRDSKHEIAYKITRPPLTKEEQVKRAQDLEELKRKIQEEEAIIIKKDIFGDKSTKKGDKK